MSLNKQVWINQIKEKFYPDSSFLNVVKNMSALVDNDKINLAEAGLDPEVLINNNTYPIRIDKRIDTSITIELDLFETTNTIVRRPEVIEYAYDQLESVLRGHRNSLRIKTATKAAHAFAPAEDSVNTPIIETNGEITSGRKKITFSDIIELKRRFDDADIPLEDRYLILNPNHVTDLLEADLKLFKNLTNTASGAVFNFAGFNLLQFSKTPKYKKDGEKWVKAGFEAEDGTNFCSFAFHADEVMRADGEIHMYSKENDPEQRGTIVGFDKRFIAMPIRNIALGAIVSSNA